MRKQLLIWATVLATLSGLWVVAVQTQGVQCGGSFIPSLNCTVSGRWLWTNTLAINGGRTQGPIPFQVRDQNNNPQDVTGIISRTVDLTNTQVLALNTTPVTIVPAPGVGYYISVVRADLIFNYTTAYTSGSDMKLYWTSRGAGNAATGTITVSGFIVSVSADTVTTVAGGPDGPEPGLNAPVVLQQTTQVAFGGGNAANSLRVVVNYRIVRTGL